MGQVPLDRLLDAVLELRLRQPAQFIMNFGRIDRITHIMSLTIRDVSDQRFRLTKLLADQLNNFNILLLIVAANIINFTDTALMNDQIDSPTVI